MSRTLPLLVFVVSTAVLVDGTIRGPGEDKHLDPNSSNPGDRAQERGLRFRTQGKIDLGEQWDDDTCLRVGKAVLFYTGLEKPKQKKVELKEENLSLITSYGSGPLKKTFGTQLTYRSKKYLKKFNNKQPALELKGVWQNVALPENYGFGPHILGRGGNRVAVDGDFTDHQTYNEVKKFRVVMGMDHADTGSNDGDDWEPVQEKCWYMKYKCKCEGTHWEACRDAGCEFENPCYGKCPAGYCCDHSRKNMCVWKGLEEPLSSCANNQATCMSTSTYEKWTSYLEDAGDEVEDHYNVARYTAMNQKGCNGRNWQRKRDASKLTPHNNKCAMATLKVGGCPAGYYKTRKNLSDEYDKIDYYGMELEKNSINSIERCGQKCDATYNCNAFEYNSGKKRCTLKISSAYRIKGSQKSGWVSCLSVSQYNPKSGDPKAHFLEYTGTDNCKEEECIKAYARESNVCT